MLYQDDLAGLACGNPQCTDDHRGQQMTFRARCHPDAGTWVVVTPGADHVHVICAACEAHVCTLAIAAKPATLAEYLALCDRCGTLMSRANVEAHRQVCAGQSA